jgi:NAD(P)-dependent dehydrogenase (short-subunit alcohol dehydrogenase family)
LDFSVEGKKVTVVGAARSGIAAARLLVERGARVTLSESRADVPEARPLAEIGVALESGGHQPATFTGADLVVLSPGVAPEQPAVAAARARGVVHDLIASKVKAAADRNPCSIASQVGGWGLPLNRMAAMIKPPAAETASNPVAVCIIRSGSIGILLVKLQYEAMCQRPPFAGTGCSI